MGTNSPHFIPEAWSAALLQKFTYYGRSETWWKYAIKQYILMTDHVPPEPLVIDGEVSLPRLRNVLLRGNDPTEKYLRHVSDFWEDHRSLADLMLPREGKHAPD